LSIWPEVGAGEIVADAQRFLMLAQTFGYPDLPLPVVLAAFRLRFRPWGRGGLDGTDMALLTDLARRFGADGGAWRTE
ncbi:MAG TPA: N-acetylmuramoyl-L-alanine amidase, partial [Paenirhodobacter sp.]